MNEVLMVIVQGESAAIILHDWNWEEYRVQFWRNRERLKDADYHTEEFDDAVGTAQAELERMEA